MSEETRELVEVLLALSPWIAFVIAIGWSAASSLWTEGPPAPSPGKREGTVRRFGDEKDERAHSLSG